MSGYTERVSVMALLCIVTAFALSYLRDDSSPMSRALPAPGDDASLVRPLQANSDPLLAPAPRRADVPRWVRTSPPEGDLLVLNDSRVTRRVNSLTLAQVDPASGKTVSNTIIWNTPPEEVQEGQLFDLTLQSTGGGGDELAGCWCSYDERERLDNAPVQRRVSNSGPLHSVTKYQFRYMGQGYENMYIELKDYCETVPASKYRIRWNYRRVAPAVPTPTTSPELSPREILDAKREGYLPLKIVAVSGEVKRQAEGVTLLIKGGGVLMDNTTIITGDDGLITLGLEDGRTVTVRGNTTVGVKSLGTEAGRREIEAFLKSGRVEVKAPPGWSTKPALDPYNPDAPPPSLSVKTPAATARSVKTEYAVSHDEKSGATAVGVAEGEVEVASTNSSLKRVTLKAQQQVSVTREEVGPVSTFSGDDLGKGGTSTLLRVVCWVLGIVAALYVVGRLAGKAPAKATG